MNTQNQQGFALAPVIIIAGLLLAGSIIVFGDSESGPLELAEYKIDTVTNKQAVEEVEPYTETVDNDWEPSAYNDVDHLSDERDENFVDTISDDEEVEYNLSDRLQALRDEEDNEDDFGLTTNEDWHRPPTYNSYNDNSLDLGTSSYTSNNYNSLLNDDIEDSDSDSYLGSGTYRGAQIDILGDEDCTRIGSASYCGDTTYTQIGDSVYGSDGSSYNRIGDTVYGSDGTSCSKIGSSTYCNDDNNTSYTEIGDSIYGSDGSSYNDIGNTTYSNPGYGY